MLSRLKQVALAASALAALALGGSALAGAASRTTSSPSTTTGTPHGTPGPGFTAANAPGTAKHENAEAAVTGANATKAQTAALGAVGGTAGAVTNNFSQNGYEVTVTKKDGSKLVVRLDSAFKVDQAGPGPGGPGPGADGPGGPAY